MTIKQVSVFLENKTGRINEVTKTLSQHGINMQAFSMAETPDFGILRLIVSDVDKAVEILRSADFAVMLTDVILLHCPNKAGALGEILEQLAVADVAIEYMYAFAEGDMANIVVRPTDIARCEQALVGLEA
ncbi:MAG: amino acid-binding protein [Bacteroidaceae bacterium]|nr:amino acid-binding protein [Bacteroidaceae bacterium]